VGVAEFEPSQYVAEEQQAAAERFMAEANDLDDVDLGLTDARPTTEQRCIDCGFKTAYYWTRQVWAWALQLRLRLRAELLVRP
jgi:hypothetical protein